MKFNPDISLGVILQLGAFLIGAAGVFLRIGRLEAKMNIMFDWFQASIIQKRGGSDLEDLTRFHGGD